MDNPFDQFDGPVATQGTVANPFDQFDSSEGSPPQGYFSRVGTDLKNRFGEAVQSVGDSEQGKQSGIETGLQILGKTMAGSVNDTIGEGVNSAVNYLPQSLKDSAKEVGQNILNTQVGKMGLSAIQEGVGAYKDWASQNPRAARDLESTIDVASMLPVAKGAEAVTDAAVAGAKDAAPSIMDVGENNAAALMARSPRASSASHVPLQTASDLTDTIFGNINNANKYYALPKEIAGAQSVAAPEVRDYLNGVISDIQSDPFHEAKPMLAKLQKTVSALPDDGTVPVGDLLDLRKTSNANFKPGRMTDKDGVYAGLNKAVNFGLDDAREQIPHFSDALDVADNYWKNSVSNPITKNPVLQKVFDMEDAHNIRQFNNGAIDDVPDATKQSANNLVSKIKDVDTYNAVRRLLPDDTGQALDKAVLDNITPTRLDAAVKLVKSNIAHPVQSIHNVADLIWPSVTPQQKALIKAIKAQNTYTPLSVKNEAADAAYDAVNAARKQRAGLLESPSIKVPPDAAPEPQKLLRGNNYDPLSPDNIGKLPAPSGQINVPNGGFRRTYNLNVGDEGQAIQSLRDIGQGRKTGGRVNTNPSEAQKEAGNYKKHHIRLYGLPIAIENPKGSIRRGKDKNGKEWACKLPVDYGYFKGTVGAAKDHVDCYVGSKKGMPFAYVLDQKNAETGRFDEHKVFLGMPSEEDVIQTYKKCFSDDNGHKRLGPITKLTIPGLKDWLANGETKKAMAKS